MATLISEISGWKATAEIVTPASAIAVDKLAMSLHAIDRERAILKALRIDPGISDEEYLIRESVLDDLMRKYIDLFEGQVPTIEWEEV